MINFGKIIKCLESKITNGGNQKHFFNIPPCSAGVFSSSFLEVSDGGTLVLLKSSLSLVSKEEDVGTMPKQEINY